MNDLHVEESDGEDPRGHDEDGDEHHERGLRNGHGGGLVMPVSSAVHKVREGGEIGLFDDSEDCS